MANEEEDEERHVEDQLVLQLQEQKDSLCSINEALAFDPSDAELLAVHEELLSAIKNAEEGLFHLKRARLLREADSALQGFNNITENVVKVESIDPTDTAPEPLKEQSYPLGSKCRFHHTDGRWYNGQIFGFDEPNSAKISFLTPTSENMTICKFFHQQRCRFGTSCRLSHGVDVPISSLKKYIPTIWDESNVGSTIWAMSEGKGGIWTKAELKSWDDDLKIAHVVFQDDGTSAKLGTKAISLSEYAQLSSEEESEESTSEQSYSSDYNEEEEDNEGPQGVGFLESSTLQRGIQTETAIFAKWENHTRGIASKMMANMGFREGMGLGASGQGIVNPVHVKVLPRNQSLDHALKSLNGEKNLEKNEKNKKSRGGKRKRGKKHAAIARAAKKAEIESAPDMFSFINTQLAEHGEKNLNDGFVKKTNKNKDVKGEIKKTDRRALIAYEDEVKELRIQVEKLEEMVKRNRNEKVVFDAATRKLNEMRRALMEAENAHESASNAVVSKEKEKRWLKF